MTESLFYIQRIRAQYDTGIFSKSDKRIADYLLEHPGAVDGETASSIAEKVGTTLSISFLKPLIAFDKKQVVANCLSN